MVTSIPTYSSVIIETPENISFQYELAGPGTRMAAYFVDFMIVFTTLGILSAAYGYLAVSLGYNGLGGTSPILDVLNAIMGGLVAIIFPLGGYWTTFEMVWSGQTPGKRLLGIRVIQDNGLPVSFPGLLLRNVFRLADAFFPFQFAVGFFMLTFSKNTQRLGDLVAGTIVVKEKKAQEAKRFKWIENTNKSDSFTINLNIDEEEFNLLIEYISIWKKLNETDRNRIAQKIVTPILQKNPMKEDPAFAPLLDALKEEAPPQKYVPAEAIMRKILEFYLVQEP